VALEDVGRCLRQRDPGVRCLGCGRGEQGLPAGELLHPVAKQGPQRLAGVAAVANVQLGSVRAGAGADVADDLPGLLVEVLVDADRAVFVAADEDRLFPARPVRRRGAGVAAAQHEQVGDHLGPGGAFVRAAR
jgi:hypothetical protein